MLQKLKEYKELITIIIFFLGGFIWLQQEFPKKSDLKSEIDSLNCLVEKYMMLTQLQIRTQSLEKEIQDFDRQINSMYSLSKNATDITLSPAMKHELEELELELSGKKNDLKTTTVNMQKICEELQRNVCREVKP